MAETLRTNKNVPRERFFRGSKLSSCFVSLLAGEQTVTSKDFATPFQNKLQREAFLTGEANSLNNRFPQNSEKCLSGANQCFTSKDLVSELLSGPMGRQNSIWHRFREFSEMSFFDMLVRAELI